MGMLSVAKFRMGWGLPSTRSTKSPARKPGIGLPVRSTTWASTRVIATSLLKTTGSSAASDPRTIVKKRAAARFIAGTLSPRRGSKYSGFEEIRCPNALPQFNGVRQIQSPKPDFRILKNREVPCG